MSRILRTLLPLLGLAVLARAAGPQRPEEQTIERYSPGKAAWHVLFERDVGGRHTPSRTLVRRSSATAISVSSDPETCAGVAVSGARGSLAEFDEVFIGVRSQGPMTVQPFTQSSGFLFRDGGDPDVTLPADGSIVHLRIRRDSIADPSMVESIGVQIRSGSNREPSTLEILAVTGVRRSTTEVTAHRIRVVDAPSAIPRFSIYGVSFTLGRVYDNPYDPGEVDVKAEFQLPSGRKVTIPAFWYQDFTLAGTEKYEQYAPAGDAQWRVRFLAQEEGTHQLRLKARDRYGYSEESDPLVFTVAASRARGPVGRHPRNPLHLQYANGAPYLPRGHNLCFEDGNPDLNGTAYYRPLLTVFGESGENWTRFWMTDFARTAIEWSSGHFSGFYAGLGTYSQRASWRVDRFMEIAAENGVQVQLVLNDHGQFSNYVNARWNPDGGSSGNPYNGALGGPVPQTSPELFFSDPTARSLYQRRLRYIIARWGAFPNLLAWELWNEVQFAGTSSRNFVNDSATRAAIIEWHREMSSYLKAQDPFNHLVTTSSDDPGYSGFSSIWNLPGIDLVQSHHYAQPPSGRDTGIRDYVRTAQQAYSKPVIIGEMGLKANPDPECNFNPEAFIGNTAVPAAERTTANRDHMKAGTVLRNGIWAAAMAQSGGMNWWWGCYLSGDSRRNRLAPDFPLNGRLFPSLTAFWGGEDPAANALETARVETQGNIAAHAVQGRSSAFFWVRDNLEAYGSGAGPAATVGRITGGAAVAFSGFAPGQYVVSPHDSSPGGEPLPEFVATVAGTRLVVPLPPFGGDLAAKVGDGTERGWGLVPRSALVWRADGDPASLRAGYAVLRTIPGSDPQQLAGAVLTLTNNGIPVSDLTVPAVPLTRTLWTVAEINAPSNVGIAAANTSAGPANLRLNIFDADGRPVAVRAFSIEPGRHTAQFLAELFAELNGPFRGSLQVASDIPVAMLTLRGTANRRGEFVLTTLPARTDRTVDTSTAMILPQLADGGGYQTEWLLVNPNDRPVSGRLRFLRPDGAPWILDVSGNRIAELDYQIAAHGVSRSITAGAAGQTQAGYCILAPSGDSPVPTAAAVIRYLQEGLQSESGVPFVYPSANGGTYWESASETYTGVAFVNGNDRVQRVRVELFWRDAGSRRLETTLDLPPGRHSARLLGEIFPDLPASGRGYLRFSSEDAVGFLALRLRNTPRGDTLTSSLLLGELSDDEERVFPQVVTGGGYQSRFIILNPGPIAAGGRIAFRDSSGAPRPILLRSP